MRMRIAGLMVSGAILFFACPAFAQMQSLGPKDTWAAAKLSAEEAEQVIAAVEQSAFDTPESWEKELLVRRVDLGNGPGIVARGTRLLCGATANCQIFVLRKVNGKWASLFGGTDAPVAEGFQFGPGLTHGIKDLTISANLSAEASKHTVYAFDGEVYHEVKKKAH